MGEPQEVSVWYVSSKQEAENLTHYLPFWGRGASNRKTAWEWFIRQNYPSALSAETQIKLKAEFQAKSYQARRFIVTIREANK